MSSRSDLFAHSMLVLSQCDVINPDMHPDLCRLLQRKGEQFKMYPFRYGVWYMVNDAWQLVVYLVYLSLPEYRHVVGVINKFYSDSEPHTLSYPIFLQQFQRTKEREMQVFREVMMKRGVGVGVLDTPGKGGEGSSDAILFSTPSLFYTIDHILLHWLETHLSSALEKLKR